MAQHETGVACPHCKDGKIVAEVESVPTGPLEGIPVGPGSRHHFRWEVTSFHCDNCQSLFYHPPGRPAAAVEILQELQREKEAKEREVLTRRFSKVLPRSMR
jgi:hypothetical protein